MYIVYGEDSGEEQAFRTLKEAKAWIKQVKDFDKRNGLSGERFFIEKEENDNV